VVVHSTLTGADLHPPAGAYTAGALTLTDNQPNAMLWREPSASRVILRYTTTTSAHSWTFGNTTDAPDVTFAGLTSSEFNLDSSHILLCDGNTIPAVDAGLWIQRTASLFHGIVWDESADEWVAASVTAEPWGTSDLTLIALPFRCAGAFANSLTLAEQGSDVATGANVGALYTKDDAGTTHLFYRANSNGTVYQLTPPGTAIDHGGLTGLGDDDHTQYALLAGRAGGQILIGGTAAGNDLSFETTSHATKGTFIWTGACDWSVGGGVGSAAQVLTSNGAGAAPTWQAVAGGGGTLDAAYDYGGAGAGRTITADTGAVLITDATAARTAYLLHIDNGAATFTGTPHGILVDFVSATQISNAGNVYGARFEGKSNDGAGMTVGISLDSGWDIGIEIASANHAIKLADGAVLGSVTGLTAVTGTIALLTGTFAGTYAPGGGSVMIGDDLGNASSTSQGAGCVVIGSQGAYAHNAANYAVAIGYTANAATSSIAIGHLATASAIESIAIGNSTPTAAGARSIAFGRGANVGSSGTESIGIGYGVSTNNANCVVLGRGATSTAANQFVLGSNGYETSQVFFGEGVVAATVPTSISINPTGASGTDIAGGCTFYLNGARGTGTGVGGDLVFQTAPPGGTGSTPGTLTERLRIDDNGIVTFSSTASVRHNGLTLELNADADAGTAETVSLGLSSGDGATTLHKHAWRVVSTNSSVLNYVHTENGAVSASTNLRLGDASSTATQTCNIYLHSSNGTNRYVLFALNSSNSFTVSSDPVTAAGLKFFLASGAATGDVLLGFDGDVTDTYLGIDDSDADAFLIGTGTTVGSNVVARIATGASDRGALTWNLPDNFTTAYVLRESANTYFSINTTNSSELVALGVSGVGTTTVQGLAVIVNAVGGALNLGSVNTTKLSLIVPDNTTSAFVLTEGANEYIELKTTNTAERLTLGFNQQIVLDEAGDWISFNSLVGAAIDQTLYCKTASLNTASTSPAMLASLATASNTSGWAEARVACRQSTDSAAYVIRVKWENAAGTVTLGTVATDWSDEDASISGNAVTFVASGANVTVQVTPANATSMNWVASFDLQGVV